MEYELLLQYGPLGIIAIVFFRFLRWHVTNSAEQIKDSHVYIKEINERRVESAEKAVEAITTVINQQNQILEILKGDYHASADMADGNGQG